MPRKGDHWRCGAIWKGEESRGRMCNCLGFDFGFFFVLVFIIGFVFGFGFWIMYWFWIRIRIRIWFWIQYWLWLILIVFSLIALLTYQDLFSGCSRIFYFQDEKFIDVVTAISGSGPAYFYYFIETLRNVRLTPFVCYFSSFWSSNLLSVFWFQSHSQAGIALGLSHEDATAMAVGTAVGASSVAAGGQDVAVLREQEWHDNGWCYHNISCKSCLKFFF
jgi:hypothetical protein